MRRDVPKGCELEGSGYLFPKNVTIVNFDSFAQYQSSSAYLQQVIGQFE